jgi:glycosyltransferase involved in cell wall biosynthesis
MNEYTIITPTGDRPEAFTLCVKYIQRQTVKPTEWIIVDDGKTPLDVSILPAYAKYIRRENTEPHKHSLTPNMLEAFKYVTTQKIVIIEDDDWYASNYCEYMLDLLGDRKIAGIGHTVYYSIPKCCYFIHDNEEHSAWCNTVFRADIIPMICEIAKQAYKANYPYIDLRIWTRFRRLPEQHNLDLKNPHISIGLKSMPGRVGTCSGHRNTGSFVQDTEDTAFLREYLGDDIKFYKSFMHPEKDKKDISKRKIKLASKISAVTLVNRKGMYESCVVRSLEKQQVELIPIYDAPSAAIGLNQGVKKASHEIVVLCHQDVLFSTEWVLKLQNQLKITNDNNFGVMGTYGIDVNTKHGIGHVISGRNTLRKGELPEKASYLDEHCLIIRKSSGLRFDESNITFHMYGADLCLQSWAQGMRCWAIDARVRHLSNATGKNNASFNEAIKWFVRKWRGNESPFKTYRTTCMERVNLCG